MVTLWELDLDRVDEMRTSVGIGGNRHCARLPALEQRLIHRGGAIPERDMVRNPRRYEANKRM